MDKNQEQNVAQDGIAIASGRDTNIGITSTQMVEIMNAISTQIGTYSSEAKQIVEMRLKEFEEKILVQFSDPNTNRQAFADPDFQFTLGKAQQTYARTDDSNVGENLIHLITERSKDISRTRLTLSLNSAIEKAGVLTSEEFSTLSLCFLLKRTFENGIKTQSDIITYILLRCGKLMSNVPKEESAYSYLESQNCASISLGEIKIMDLMRGNYPGILVRGLPIQDIMYKLPPDRKNIFSQPGALAQSMYDEKLYHLQFSTKEKLVEWSKSHNLREDEIDLIWGMFQETRMSDDQILSLYTKFYPKFGELVKLWDESTLKNLELTTVGLAIAHSNLTRINLIKAPLDIWIK